MICIVGGRGNMGRRYEKILKYLGKESHVVDTHNDWDLAPLKKAKGFIIATPTGRHIDDLLRYGEYRKPVLCEKPVITNLTHLRMIASHYDRIPLAMVFQYSFLAYRMGKADTKYDYYNHGKDGLAWDCLQIIGLARGEMELKEESPIWDCKINGRYLRSSDMDHAYIMQIEKWLQDPGYQDMGEIIAIHEKTKEYADRIQN